MMDLLRRVDPAAGEVVDRAELRSLVDEKLGIAPPIIAPSDRRVWRPWLAAALGFALVAVFFVPQLLRQPNEAQTIEGAFGDIAGVVAVIYDTPGEGGGVRTIAVDAERIWVMSANARELVEIDAVNNRVIASHSIDAYVEGVALGGGYLWLRSYDNDGEILRFDPRTGQVDMTIPVSGIADPITWWDDHLLVGTESGEISQIDVDGQVTPFGPGKVIVAGGSRLWLQVAQTGAPGGLVLISSDGNTASFSGTATQGIESGGYLWVIGDDHALYRLEIDGESEMRIDTGPYVHDIVDLAGSIWATDYRDDTLSRVDPATGEVTAVMPLGGRPGAIVGADGSLFVSLYQPGLLLRIDPAAELASRGEVVIDEASDDRRFLCTGTTGGPTVVLDPVPWLGPGMWSYVQSELSESALVCSHGLYQDSPFEPGNIAARADDLMQALDAHGITGPIILVSVGEGVYSTRELADRIDNEVGVVLVDPIAPGFNEWLLENMPENAPDPFVATPDMSGLSDFGDLPLVVVSHDMGLTFKNPDAPEVFGSAERADELAQLWTDGTDTYLGLSTNSKLVIAADSLATFQVVWQRPDVVIDVIRTMLAEISG